jgi:ADP-heptose:LPS heptosyltransferase
MVKFYNRIRKFAAQIVLAWIYTIVGMADWLCRRQKCAVAADLLLVRVDAIGDFVLWQDSLRAFRQKYAGCRVVLICSHAVYDLAAMDDFFTEIWAMDRKKFAYSVKYRLKFVKKLKQYSFSEVISPVFSRDYHADRLVKLAHAPTKIGYDGCLSFTMTWWQRKWRNRWFTKIVKCDDAHTSELLINANFVRQVCDKNFMPQLPTLRVKNDYKIEGEYVVMSLSASVERKAWSVDNFCKLAEYIPQKYRIVLLGNGINDEIKGRYFSHKLTNIHEVLNLIGKTTLPQTAQIIAGAKLLIGNDSAAVHIAAAVRTRSISIACGANYERFVKYPAQAGECDFHPKPVVANMKCFNCGYRCIYPIRERYECIRRINVEDVTAAITAYFKT